MKNSRIVSYLVVAMFLFTGFAWAADVSGNNVLDVKVEILCGQLQLTRSTVVQAYQPGAPVLEGDILETQEESKAELTYSDGTRMRLKPSTKVEVHAVSLKIFKGQTWHQFTKRGTEFVIETPSLVAGIRGTQFDIMVNQRGKSILSVLEGKVSVKNHAHPAEVMVKQGYATTGFVGGKPTTPIKFNMTKKAAEWQESEWMTSSNVDPFTKALALDAKYQALKKKFGDNDWRTLKAKDKAEEAKKATETK